MQISGQSRRIPWGWIAGLVLCLGLTTAVAESCETTGRRAVAVSVKSMLVPAKAWEHFEKARKAAEQHKDADFERESARALGDAPAFAQLYLLRATQQLRLRDYTAAIASVAEARRIEPGLPWAGIILASAYNGLGRHAEAVAALSPLRATEANTWQALYEMARGQIGLRDVENSLRWSAMAAAAAPETCPDAKLLRANALVLAQRWSEAAEQMRSYLASGHAGSVRDTVAATIDRLEKKQRDEAAAKTLATVACVPGAVGPTEAPQSCIAEQP